MLPIRPQQAYSFVVDFLNNSIQPFLLSSFHSILSILPEALRCSCCRVSFHLVKFMFYSFHDKSEFSLNPFSLIRFLSRSNQSGFIVYLIPWAFDSRHSRRSSFLLECSRFFASSLEFLFHLIHFPFRLGPKISGRDLLLVEECCNAPDPMRQVSASYLPLLPCHLLACCILPCHHLHCICMFFKTCIRSCFAGSLRCSFGVQTHSHAPAAPLKYYFISGIKNVLGMGVNLACNLIIV